MYKLDLSTLFDLESHGPDVFVGVGPRYPWGGLYGGQIVAQALRAAAMTVDTTQPVHSLRAYFIRRRRHSMPPKIHSTCSRLHSIPTSPLPTT